MAMVVAKSASEAAWMARHVDVEMTVEVLPRKGTKRTPMLSPLLEVVMKPCVASPVEVTPRRLLPPGACAAAASEVRVSTVPLAYTIAKTRWAYAMLV